MPPQTEHCIFMMERKQEPAGGGSGKGETARQRCRGWKRGQKSANYNSIVDDFPNKYK